MLAEPLLTPQQLLEGLPQFNGSTGKGGSATTVGSRSESPRDSEISMPLGASAASVGGPSGAGPGMQGKPLGSIPAPVTSQALVPLAGFQRAARTPAARVCTPFSAAPSSERAGPPPEGFFHCSKCKLNKPIEQRQIRSGCEVCCSDVASYQSLVTRWKDKPNLKLWWRSLGEVRRCGTSGCHIGLEITGILGGCGRGGG